MAQTHQLGASDTIETLVGTADDVLLFDTTSGGSSFPLLTISEVARLLRVSQSGVRRLQQQRQIPFIKVGGSVRFSKEDIVLYLRRQRIRAIG